MNLNSLLTSVAQVQNESFVGAAALLMIVGMLVVFVALILIMFVLQFMGRIVSGQEAPPPAVKTGSATPQTPGAASAVPAVPPQDYDIHPEVLAVITAAVVAAVRSPVRIRRVRLVSQGATPIWGERGRTAIHTSHRIRKGSR